MRWKEEYATGIASVDDQHKMIFKMAKDFNDALVEGQGERVYGILLRFLSQYVKKHFEVEEQCMAKYNCPKAQENIDAHRAFEDVLLQYSEQYEKVGYTYEDASQLMRTIEKWLSNHICKIDRHLRDRPRRASA
ncbi:hemerythrin family protein [Pelagicoccus sp. NFK12]|jgi:hemerythrin|uniref:Hemerythrin family protein n=1 Tax=Pelagicoccus enzymogenes TaxID=2773457 RepID=A0A927F462_9BACT|nr:hemerythrin family protein [Pelagicoccus enzymogenes]MBD5778097.1 hemerythrin family protein [Pelagicoccus enzymogenes]MDQ8198147.1 hemerythrin family protein [Pelagicoccus enzymogenes]